MLNDIWPVFILVSIFYSFFSGNLDKINMAITNSTQDALNLTLTLIGITCLWRGIMDIA